MRVLSLFFCALALALPCVLGEQAKRSVPELPAVLLTSLTTATLLYPLDLLRSLSMQSPGSSVVALVKGFHADFGMRGFVSQGLSSEVGASRYCARSEAKATARGEATSLEGVMNNHNISRIQQNDEQRRSCSRSVHAALSLCSSLRRRKSEATRRCCRLCCRF